MPFYALNRRVTEAEANASVQAANTQGISVALVIGPELIGILFNWALLGTLLHQVQIYATNFHRKDPRWVKLIVYGVTACEILFTGIITHYVYTLLIKGWGVLDNLRTLPWSSTMIFPGDGFVSAVVQIFFAWRIWKFGNESRMTQAACCLICVLALLQFSATIAFTVPWLEETVCKLRPEMTRGTPELLISTLLWLVGSFVTDLLIAGLMVLSLFRSRRILVSTTAGTASARTISAINSLIIRALETGILTTVVALIALILYIHPNMRKNNFYITPVFCIGKLYSTMLLANLIGRKNISESLRTMPSDVMAPHTLQLRTDIMVTTTVESDLEAEQPTEKVAGKSI